MKKIFLFSVYLFSSLTAFVSASDVLEDLQIPLEPTARVTDLADILSTGEEMELNEMLKQFTDTQQVEITVVTLKSLDEYAIEEVGIELADAWGVGKDEIDSGIIIIAAMDEKQRRIETGYGIEGDLPDILAYQLGKDHLVPAFREGNYMRGFTSLIESIKDVLTGVYVDFTQSPQAGEINDRIGWLIMLGILSFLIATILRGLFGDDMSLRKSASSIGPAATGVTGMIVGGLAGGFFLFMIMSLLWSMIMLAQQINSPRKKSPWDAGFGGFTRGGGRGGGSFGGGFSGFGGGSFGGGGASGSW